MGKYFLIIRADHPADPLVGANPAVQLNLAAFYRALLEQLQIRSIEPVIIRRQPVDPEMESYCAGPAAPDRASVVSLAWETLIGRAPEDLIGVWCDNAHSPDLRHFIESRSLVSPFAALPPLFGMLHGSQAPGSNSYCSRELAVWLEPSEQQLALFRRLLVPDGQHGLLSPNQATYNQTPYAPMFDEPDQLPDAELEPAVDEWRFAWIHGLDDRANYGGWLALMQGMHHLISDDVAEDKIKWDLGDNAPRAIRGDIYAASMPHKVQRPVNWELHQAPLFAHAHANTVKPGSAVITLDSTRVDPAIIRLAAQGQRVLAPSTAGYRRWLAPASLYNPQMLEELVWGLPMQRLKPLAYHFYQRMQYHVAQNTSPGNPALRDTAALVFATQASILVDAILSDLNLA